MGNELLILALLVVVVGGFAFLYFGLRQMLERYQQSKLEETVDRVFGLSVEKIAQQSKEVLASEKEIIKTDLENKQQVMEKLVKQLQDDLKTRQEEIRDLERDRSKKFSELQTALENHQKLTDELKVSTKQLAEVLSNNQQRGEWGERIIEDLLKANGLVEGVHYAKQTSFGSQALRPDITLLLPNKRKVAVDVKFPYREIQKMAVAETKASRKNHLQQFRRDLKNKINKVAEYIDPSSDTLDYAIMFVPNEMVFSFLNQECPDLVDEAVAKRVLIVSPFTFLIVARTVLESYRNFMIGDTLREIVGYVDEFVGEWGRFQEKFQKYGRSIQTLQSDYEELTGTRVRQMERRIEKIQSYQAGSLLPDEKKK